MMVFLSSVISRSIEQKKTSKRIVWMRASEKNMWLSLQRNSLTIPEQSMKWEQKDFFIEAISLSFVSFSQKYYIPQT
jgi:hypothetical protein